MSARAAAAPILPRDRLAFTLFLAVSLHAALILGIGVSSDLNLERTPSIEVTLSLSKDAAPPEHADYIAATNQVGSGDVTLVNEPTTRERTPFHDDSISPVEQEAVPAPSDASDRHVATLTTTADAPQQSNPQDEVLERSEQPSLREQSYESLLKEIASLEARIAEEEQADAKGPRTRRLTQVSTKSAAEAAYLNMWREKVERIGNANFPDAGLFGNLRLLVVLRADGTLADVRVITPSGHQRLDAAAERIVRLAAPFQPFPVEMRKKYDRLEIIRTWKFSRSGTAL